jgi:hypothetical protein
MKSLLACSLMMLIAAIAFSQPAPQDADVRSAGIETSYDRTKDITTVRLMPVQISGEKDRYQSLHMSPSFSYPGRVYLKPEIVDFELQTIVRGRLNSDLYVVFLIEGEKIFLSSNRWGIKRPVPGRVWMGERLVFRMPFATLLKLANARHAAVRLDGISFEFKDAHKRALKTFAESAAKP